MKGKPACFVANQPMHSLLAIRVCRAHTLFIANAHSLTLVARFLPAVYVLRWKHVVAALREAPLTHYGALVLWIHSATLSIEDGCFRECFDLDCTGVVRVCTAPTSAAPGAPSRVVAAAVLGALMRRIGAYEPAIVEMIREFAVFVPGIDEAHRIGNDAFAGCKNRLDDVVLPPTFTHIGDNAFRNSHLMHVTPPSLLTHIGARAFRECCWLTRVTLPDSLVCIDDEAFRGCSRLREVHLHECTSLTHIGDDAFTGCHGLDLVTLPESLSHLGESAFFKCISLTSLSLPRMLTRIRACTFEGCSSLRVVELRSSLTRLDDSAFHGCSQLMHLILPPNSRLTYAGDDVFWGCKRLTLARDSWSGPTS